MFKARLGREVAIILLIKLTLLYSLWAMCFKHTKQPVTGETFATRIYS
jgi:hypothetical protein